EREGGYAPCPPQHMRTWSAAGGLAPPPRLRAAASLSPPYSSRAGRRVALILNKILPAIRSERRAGDQPGLVRGEERDAARDFFGFAEPADRDQRQDRFLQHVLGYRLHHLGVDITRANRIHRNARARGFLRQRLGEPELAGLGGGIIGLAHLAFLAVDRGDVDDAAELAGAHALDHRPAHVEQRAEVCA